LVSPEKAELVMSGVLGDGLTAVPDRTEIQIPEAVEARHGCGLMVRYTP
jgi:hypothetical protein